nr:IS701 family transposase [Halomonas populi]
MLNDLTLENVRKQTRDWESTLSSWLTELGGYVKRAEAQERLGAYLRGLLGDVERRNSWQLAEHQGDAHPYGFQHLINRARWDEDGVRDAVRQRVYEALHDDDGVLVVDETGFLKKGHHSAGVKRQYSGTAGRIKNCQIGVFLGYASCWGQGLIDRALFLPRDWADDRERCRQAGIPEHVSHMPKTALAREMLKRALNSGVTARWVTGDAVMASPFSCAGPWRSVVKAM